MRCNTTMKHFTSSKEMLNKLGVVPLAVMCLQHSYSRQEKHKQLKHLRLRFVNGRNVPSHSEFINILSTRLASSSCNQNHGTVCAEQSTLLLIPPPPSSSSSPLIPVDSSFVSQKFVLRKAPKRYTNVFFYFFPFKLCKAILAGCETIRPRPSFSLGAAPFEMAHEQHLQTSSSRDFSKL